MIIINEREIRVAEKEKKIQYERARKAARGQSNRAETKRKKKEMEKEEKRVNDAKMIKLQREARLLRTSTPELSSSELRKRQTLRDKMVSSSILVGYIQNSIFFC